VKDFSNSQEVMFTASDNISETVLDRDDVTTGH